MVTQSILIGLLFGTIWGLLFSERYKKIAATPTDQRLSARFLASTSVIRYLLLAALLVVLITKYSLIISWWLLGFLVSFWAISIWSIKNLGKDENSNI